MRSTRAVAGVLSATLMSVALGAAPAQSPAPARISGVTVEHVGPRILVLAAQCENMGDRVEVAAVIRDRDGLIQSFGSTPVPCNTGGQPMNFLISVPDGTGALKASEIVFTIFLAGAPKPFMQRVPLPPQPNVELPPMTRQQAMLARLRGPDPPYVASYRLSFDLHDFAAIDRLFDHLDRDEVALSNGMSADEEYWPALSERLGGPDRVEWSKRVLEWQRTSPRSVAALVAAGLEMQFSAWSVRGSSTDESLDPVARGLFLGRLSNLENFLRRERKIGSRSPLYFELMMAVLDDEGKPSLQIGETGATALNLFPNHPEIYVDMADPRTLHMLLVDPNRDTSSKIDWAHADQLIRLATAQKSPPATYALAYRALFARQPIEFEPFSDSLASWSEMKPSFDALFKAYPSAANLNSFAAYSCRAGDWAAYRTLRGQLDGEDLDPKQWPDNLQPQVCDAAAAKSTS